MKVIWQTPEFWATIIGNTLGIVVLLGGLTSDEAGELSKAAQAIVGGLLSVLTLFGFIKAQMVRKAIAVQLLIARINKQGDDAVADAAALGALDKDVRDLFAAL
jgi:hypothetical protein